MDTPSSRHKSLAKLYIDKEQSIGQAKAALWLYRELLIQGADDISRDVKIIESHIKEISNA